MIKPILFYFYYLYLHKFQIIYIMNENFFNRGFSETEIPYDILARFGLTQEMIDDFPESIMVRFLSGRETPVLPITVEMNNGEIKHDTGCIRLFRKQDGSVDIIFSPRWREKQLNEFEEVQRQQLLAGNVIVVELEDGMHYAQFNPCINQAIFAKVDAIKDNIRIIADGKLSPDDILHIESGEILELKESPDNILSIGIDLMEMSCLRLTRGDKLMWKEEQKVDLLPQFNFGIYGCWVKNPITQDLTYIKEEDFTQDMKDEMYRQGQQRATKVQMGHGLHL